MEIRKKYVAYGSNLNLEQMQRRCPTAKVVGKGEIKGYELLFRGNPSASYATVEPKEGASVPVLIWEIGEEDEKHLDWYEGYPRLYCKKNIPVETEDGTESIMVYIMNDGPKIGKPSDAYLNTIKRGFHDAGFDIAFLDERVEYCNRLIEEAVNETGMANSWGMQHM